MGNGPHDALFRKTFSSVEHAAAELRAVLPPALRSRIDLSKLQLAPGSYVDSDLAASQSDLLFSVEMAGKPGLLYLLFEHQSTVDDLMAFRVLKYVVRILDQHIRGAKSAVRALPLPVVIPVVLHHSETGWTAATDLQDLFDGGLAKDESLAAYVPQLSFVLDDISHLTDDELNGRALGLVPTLTLWALRDARTPERLLRSLLRWGSAMEALAAAESGREALLTIFRYLTLVVPDLTPDALHQNLRTLTPEVEQIVMTTLAEQWMAQGEARGELNGTRNLLLRQLELKFGNLSKDERQRVDSADAEQICRWSVRILNADSLAAVLAD